jgi:hypothetical protein
MTDRELLETCAKHFEFLRRCALAGGKIKRNGIPVPKWRVVAEECTAAQKRVLEHLAETPS